MNQRFFRDWAKTTYGSPKVESTLLKAQDDAGLNVNLLLWCCWAGAFFETAPELVIRHAIADGAQWREKVTENLRNARRSMKRFESQPGYEDVAVLRARLKEIELTAEFIEIDRLEAIAVAHLKAPADDTATSRARRNLAQYASLTGAAQHKGFSTQLLQDVIDHIFIEMEEPISQDPVVSE